MLRLVTLTSALALSAATAMAEDIKVGVSPGEHAEIMEEVAKVAEPMGLNIEVVEFSDYVIPNTALADGDIQANSFQHRPYLENQVKDRGFDLVEIGTTITTPMGIYSDKLESLDALPEGAKIGIPNDPTNGGRALLLLAKAGLIGLTPGMDFRATVADITENPKRLRIVELEAAQVARSLDDVDAAVVITDYALIAGLDPAKFPATWPEVAEAIVDGEWVVVDATGLAPRQSLVRISTGRDAADTAFLDNHRGSINLNSYEVTATVRGELPIDDGNARVRIG